MELSYKSTSIDDLYLLSAKFSTDHRGSFTKHFQQSLLETIIKEPFVESYYSVSRKGTVRGMHYQAPPNSHLKLVIVPKGSVTDVVLDLRCNSQTFGRYEAFQLNDKNKLGLLIPEGLAHGFLANENQTIVFYQQTSEYSEEADSGILWNSFGFDWGISTPNISDRDRNFIKFNEFAETHRKLFSQ